MAQRQKVLSRRPEFTVLARIRPGLHHNDQSSIDLPAGSERHLSFNDPRTNPSGTSKTFTFHRVFQLETSNSTVLEEITGLIDSVVNGSTVYLFSYGQTGSEKSHAMSLKPDGIFWASMHRIFETTTQLRKVTGSCIEVYMDKLRDLVQTENKPEIVY